MAAVSANKANYCFLSFWDVCANATLSPGFHELSSVQQHKHTDMCHDLFIADKYQLTGLNEWFWHICVTNMVTRRLSFKILTSFYVRGEKGNR